MPTRSLQQTELDWTKVSFQSTIAKKRNYIPTLSLFKDNKKILAVTCRNTRKGINHDQDFAFMEMFATIASVDPDFVIFSADAHLDIRAALDNGHYENEHIPIEESGTNAFYRIMASRSRADFIGLDPYILDKDRGVWWINLPNKMLTQTADDGLDRRGTHQIAENISRMFSSVGTFPFKTSELFDALSNMGHLISVLKGFHVE